MLCVGDVIDGLVIVVEQNGMIVVEFGWCVVMIVQGNFVLMCMMLLLMCCLFGIDVDLVWFEIFNNLFMLIVEQMGLWLQNIVYLVNIKEWFDFLCVIFDGDGNLIVNVLYMFVYFGLMGESICMVIECNCGCMCDGDVFMLNDLYYGGMYLLDVMVIMLVFVDGLDVLLFYVGLCGYYVDIGGMMLGLMLFDLIYIDEEGVLIDNWQFVLVGVLCDVEMCVLLVFGCYLVCNVEQNMVDLCVQVVVNQKGVDELCWMVVQFGCDVVFVFMGYVQDNVEEVVWCVIGVLQDGVYCYLFDNGVEICVVICVDCVVWCVEIDFIGMFVQFGNNFNVLKVVCMVVVLYVFCMLVGDDILLNVGCLKLLIVIVLVCLMFNFEYLVVVVLGNVEMLLVIINVLYGVFGCVVLSQGMMNNFIFGNYQYQYYEMIVGGSGVGNGFVGVGVVQMYMMNLWFIDLEVFEWCYLVWFDLYWICVGLGGGGCWCGGDGVV